MNEDQNFEEVEIEALMDLKIKDKCRTFLMFYQLKEHGEAFAFDVILNYVRALNESLQVSGEKQVLQIHTLEGISDIFFDKSDIVFLGPDKEEILRVYAPC